MHRNQQYESRYVEGGYHEEAPFFREAIGLIDECTKLIKDDRIILRNKIKEYLRALRENRITQNQQEIQYFNQLVQIFLEANKKKSLAKIQKGDRTMDWLQIKLRKFIDCTKKEKHKRELQNFKKGKYLDCNKSSQPSKDNRSSSRNQADRRQVLGASRGSNYQQDHSRHIIPSSLSRSRDKEPVESSRRRKNDNSYANYSYHQKLSFLNKGNKGISHNTSKQYKDVKGVFDQEKSVNNSKMGGKRNSNMYNLNRSLDNLNTSLNRSLHSSKNKAKQPVHDFSKQLNKFNQKKVTNTNKPVPMDRDQHQKHEINKLTQLFSKQLSSEQPKLQYDYKPSYNNKNFKELDNQIRSNPIDSLSDREKNHLQTFSRYAESNKKIQEMLEGSKQLLDKINSHESSSVQFAPEPIVIQPEFTFKDNQFSIEKSQFSLPSPVNLALPQFSENKLDIHPLNPPSKDNFKDIFTPPDFLAECRKFIENSNKKKTAEEQEWQDAQISEGNDKIMTFSNLLGESRENRTQKASYFNPFGINQVTSENASVNISSKKPESEVNFRFKNPTIQSTQQLLLEMFKFGHSVSLDRFQIGEIMSKCNLQTEKMLQNYCEVVEKESSAANSFEFNFISTLKYFYTYGKVFREQDGHFAHFLCSILDMNKNGYIGSEEINDFVESMQSSEIEGEILSSIGSSLQSVFRRCCEIEGGGSILTCWSLYYLQLRQDEELSKLKDLLSSFQFQVETD